MFHTVRMVGGIFEGTNGDPVTGPYTVIYTISSNPPLAWNEISVDLKDYRYLRYRAPTDSFGNVAEIEFYRDGAKITGQGFGTPGSWSDQGSTFDKALDGNIDTFFDAPINTGAYVGLDTAAAPVGPFTLTVYHGSGSGNYPAGALVRVTADAPEFGQEFSGWTGDIVILSNPFIPTTTATIPWMDVAIDASYSALPTYMVTVTNGTGDGDYLADEQVAIAADPAPAGQQFAGWIGNVTFANASSPTTTFTMPASAVAVTATYSASTGPVGTGLRGQYYNDSSNAPYPLANPSSGAAVLTRTDGEVDFDWGSAAPASQINTNFFSVKWTGQLKAPISGSYTFTVRGDDGVRLFLNGTKVIDGWRDQGATPYSFTTTLTADTLYDIELHYYEHEGNAECRLQWSYPGQSTRAIPQSQLYPSAGP
ncbi:MAG TPA: PA14 domain-containing protein [Terrimicrobiaceae bacterium]|nr:PA14 domain-containing protein [Terrimicrobiaceae bacterium]